MNPVDGAHPNAQCWEPWPARSNAQVTFFLGEQAAAQRIARRIFHRSLAAWEYAGLVGAPDDTRVEIGTLDGHLYIEWGDPIAASYRAHYYVRRVGDRIIMTNDGIRIARNEMRHRGFGFRVFYRQINVALALGIDCIEVTAGRRDDENGYYTWPRFGFDGALSMRVRCLLPESLKPARTLLDLMENEQGRAWWREYGETIVAQFSLAPGSRSLAIWERYAWMKTNLQNGPKRNLENQAAIAYCIAR
jgi:hypothetical protein